MKKLTVLVPALALAVMMSANALAENGAVSEATMQEMGLGGMQVMSDQEALAVRGKGFLVPGSASLAFGASYATIGNGGILSPNSTGAVNGYLADGTYMAGGSQLSEATRTTTNVEILTVQGLPATTMTTIRTRYLAAGGFSMSTSL